MKTPRYPTQQLDTCTCRHVPKGRCSSLHLVSIFFVVHPFALSLHFFYQCDGFLFSCSFYWLPANSGSSWMPEAPKLHLITQLLNCCSYLIIFFFHIVGIHLAPLCTACLTTLLKTVFFFVQ